MDNALLAVSIFNKYASEYQAKFMDTKEYHNSFNLFCNAITKTNATVLELGCGPGNITQYLLHKRNDFKILATDLSANMLKLAKQNNLAAKFKLLDCRKINTLKNNYDAIMCGFCLPYLTTTQTTIFIKDAALKLNTNGILYISTMLENEFNKSGNKAGSKGDVMYMNYHKDLDILNTLTQNNFKVLHFIEQNFETTDGIKTIDGIFIAKKISE